MRNLKEFIEVNKNDINLRLFEKVYSLANKELPYTGVGKLTELFYKCGIDPLNFLNKIPDNYAFNSSITKITIPANIKSIGYCAFDYCGSLASIIIPDSVIHINDYAFRLCISLTGVTIGDNVTNIGDSAFRDCGSLTSVNIPDSVTHIGDDAFCYCHSLMSVTIGSGITSIGRKVFSRCTSLKIINYRGNREQWNMIDLHREWNGSSSIETVRCVDGDIGV